VAIADVDTPGSDGWWMKFLAGQLRDKQRRLARLENYRRGTPPHPSGSENLSTEPLYRFHRQCRSNFADLIVQARTDRIGIRAVRTAAGHDDDGDAQVTTLLQASGLLVAQADINRMVATFAEAYTSISAAADGETWPRIVAEDPREVITASDPADARRVIAAFKLYHDDIAGLDYAILWRPGRKVVSYRKRAAKVGWIDAHGRTIEPRITFSPASFTVLPETDSEIPDELSTLPADMLLLSESYALKDIPVRPHVARDGVGVFELHTDLLDRINHMILQRVVIATLQAFRQRAIELTEDLPEFDENGKKIDYNDLFAADPGALWKLPLGAKIWESGQVQLDGILAGCKDDIQHLASVTRTPFSMFNSSDTNQTAEGAQLTREGLVFAVEDFQRMETQPMIETISIAVKLLPDNLRYADDGTGNQVDRADPAGMTIDWLPAERYSLAERAAADAQAASLPRRQRLARIWGLTPAEVDVAMGQAAEDALLAPLPTPTPPNRDAAPGTAA
jgi:hypothetical protein